MYNILSSILSSIFIGHTEYWIHRWIHGDVDKSVEEFNKEDIRDAKHHSSFSEDKDKPLSMLAGAWDTIVIWFFILLITYPDTLLRTFGNMCVLHHINYVLMHYFSHSRHSLQWGCHRFHFYHHHQEDFYSHNFGITTPYWDIFYSTATRTIDRKIIYQVWRAIPLLGPLTFYDMY